MTTTSSSEPAQTFSGLAHVHMPNTLRLLSNQVRTAGEALSEYLDNGRDAGANLLVVALYPDRVEIFDNGHGMMPGMLEEPYGLLQEYKAEVNQGRVVDFDVRDIIGSAGSSYQWLMECIAFSRKRPEKGDRVLGMRGIGMLAFRHLGAKPVWYSKPAANLAEEYYGEGSHAAKNPPIAVLYPPTADALDRGDMKYRVETTRQTRMMDPLGHTHPSGTRIVITDLVRDIANSLRPAHLADEFRKRYGADIRLNRLKILIVDHMTVEGKRDPKGRIFEVEPLAYLGTLVLNKSASILGGQGEFASELYYNPAGRNLRITLRRRGADISPDVASVISLHGLDVEPFNSGKLNGFIELPDLPENLFPLNTAKTLPVASPGFTEYVNQIRKWRREIQAAIEETEARARDKSTQNAMRNFSGMAMEAVREVAILANLLSIGSPLPSTSRIPQVTRDMIVQVLDEFNQGIEGVTVELHQGRKTLSSLQTGPRGGFSFGRYEPGLFTFQLIVPKGMTVPSGIERYANIKTTEERPGFRAIFHLHTGAPQPEQPQRREIGARITIVQRVLPDVTQPYSIEQLPHGQIHINVEAEDFRRALESGDEELRDEYIAVYAANAIVEHTMKDYPPGEQIMTAAILASKLLRIRKAAPAPRVAARRR